MVQQLEIDHVRRRFFSEQAMEDYDFLNGDISPFLGAMRILKMKDFMTNLHEEFLGIVVVHEKLKTIHTVLYYFFPYNFRKQEICWSLHLKNILNQKFAFSTVH